MSRSSLIVETVKVTCFLQNSKLKFLKPSETSKKILVAQQNPEIIPKLSIFDFTFGWEHQNNIFLPKKGPYITNRTNGKRRKTLLHSVSGSTVKILNLTFGPNFFPDFPTCKVDFFGRQTRCFSRWPPKLGSPFKWDSQKGSQMRRIVKFRPLETPCGKFWHGTPKYYGWLIWECKKGRLWASRVMKLWFFTEKTQMLQINDDLDIFDYMNKKN